MTIDSTNSKQYKSESFINDHLVNYHPASAHLNISNIFLLWGFVDDLHGQNVAAFPCQFPKCNVLVFWDLSVSNYIMKWTFCFISGHET